MDNYNQEFITIETDEYYKIIHSIKELYQELNIDDSFEIFMVYTYMLWNGYFSLGKKYEFSYDRKIIENSLGAGIVTGVGTCLENANMLNDIYITMRYKSEVVLNRLKKLKFNEKLIKRNIKNNNPTNVKSKFNHLSVIVNDDNYNYIYDPTNITCFYLLNKKKAIAINNKGTMYLDIKSDFYSENELKHLNRILNNINFNENVAIEKTIYRMKEMIELCKKNEKYFDLFYNDNMENMENLCNKIKIIK